MYAEGSFKYTAKKTQQGYWMPQKSYPVLWSDWIWPLGRRVGPSLGQQLVGTLQLLVNLDMCFTYARAPSSYALTMAAKIKPLCGLKIFIIFFREIFKFAKGTF